MAVFGCIRNLLPYNEVNLSNWSKASSVTTGGSVSCRVPVPFPGRRAKGCQGAWHSSGSWGSSTVLLLRHQALKKMLMKLEITFALQMIQFVLAL